MTAYDNATLLQQLKDLKTITSRGPQLSQSSSMSSDQMATSLTSTPPSYQMRHHRLKELRKDGSGLSSIAPTRLLLVPKPLFFNRRKPQTTQPPQSSRTQQTVISEEVDHDTSSDIRSEEASLADIRPTMPQRSKRQLTPQTSDIIALANDPVQTTAEKTSTLADVSVEKERRVESWVTDVCASVSQDVFTLPDYRSVSYNAKGGMSEPVSPKDITSIRPLFSAPVQHSPLVPRPLTINKIRPPQLFSSDWTNQSYIPVQAKPPKATSDITESRLKSLSSTQPRSNTKVDASPSQSTEAPVQVTSRHTLTTKDSTVSNLISSSASVSPLQPTFSPRSPTAKSEEVSPPFTPSQPHSIERFYIPIESFVRSNFLLVVPLYLLLLTLWCIYFTFPQAYSGKLHVFYTIRPEGPDSNAGTNMCKELFRWDCEKLNDAVYLVRGRR